MPVFGSHTYILWISRFDRSEYDSVAWNMHLMIMKLGTNWIEFYANELYYLFSVIQCSLLFCIRLLFVILYTLFVHARCLLYFDFCASFNYDSNKFFKFLVIKLRKPSKSSCLYTVKTERYKDSLLFDTLFWILVDTRSFSMTIWMHGITFCVIPKMSKFSLD